MYGYSFREPTRSLFLNHPQIIPFDKLCVIQILLFIFKIKNNLIKHNFDLKYRYNTHTHSIRQGHNLNIPLSTTNICRLQINYVQRFNRVQQTPKQHQNNNYIYISQFKYYIYNIHPFQ